MDWVMEDREDCHYSATFPTCRNTMPNTCTNHWLNWATFTDPSPVSISVHGSHSSPSLEQRQCVKHYSMSISQVSPISSSPSIDANCVHVAACLLLLLLCASSQQQCHQIQTVTCNVVQLSCDIDRTAT